MGHWLTIWFEKWQQLLADYSVRLWVFAALYVMFAMVEVLFPAERHQGLVGRMRNLIFAALYVLVGLAVVSVVVLAVRPPMPVLPNRGPLVSAWYCFLYLLVGDFLYYWYHRAQHGFSWLWPVHELHHADNEVNAMTSMRTYWLELPIQTLLITMPTMVLCGIDINALKATIFIGIFILVLAHANVRLPLGPLTPWICGPQVHRIHHSVLPQHRDKNFAQFFPFIDVVFGTYWSPRRGEYPPTGTDDLATDAGVAEVLARPFSQWLSGTRPQTKRRKRF